MKLAFNLRQFHRRIVELMTRVVKDADTPSMIEPGMILEDAAGSEEKVQL